MRRRKTGGSSALPRYLTTCDGDGDDDSGDGGVS